LTKPRSAGLGPRLWVGPPTISKSGRSVSGRAASAMSRTLVLPRASAPRAIACAIFAVLPNFVS